MLQTILCFFIIVLVVFIAVKIKMIASFWRFMELAETVINLYEHQGVKKLLEHSKELQKGTIKLEYKNHKWEFSNADEIGYELERMINEALECYSKIDTPTMPMEEKEQKEKLVNIGCEIRIIRWKQGI